MHYLDQLNEIQKEAVTEIQGPVMINAGPGSGKTRVLTYRIAFMMEQGIEPFNILALTFTNKASKEMKERIEKINGTSARNLFMGTFHSVFARILRTKANLLGYTNNFTIYDTDDAKSVLKAIIKEFALDEDLYKVNTIYNKISSLKNELINANLYAKTEQFLADDIESNRPKFAEVYKAYAKKCFNNNAMDFDDLLIKMYELLVRSPETLYELQHKFQYLLVDEFQDTNFAQYEILKKIAAVYENICVVGDDSQSIYAFRGASIENILHFKKDYPDAKIFKLEQNYRSTKNIVKAANLLIKKNTNQIEKDIWTENVEGDKIIIQKTHSDNDEGKQVAEAIFYLKQQHQLKNNDIAILYRTNSQSRSFEEALRRMSIPYTIYGGISFYQRKEVKDLLAYLKLVVNPYEEESLKRVINYPLRGVGDTTVNKLVLHAKMENIKLWDALTQVEKYADIQPKTKGVIADFVIMLKAFASQLDTNPYELAENVAKTTGIMRELHNDKSVEGLSRYENLQALLNSVKEYVENDEILGDETMDNEKSLGNFLQSITLLTDTDKKNEEDDSVKLMTIHASKGLEYKAVFLVGLEEGLFPSQKSLYDRDDLEEERRLFYVAITRAEEFLTISFATSRYKYGTINMCQPSRFINEVPEDIVELKGLGAVANDAPAEPKSYQWKNPVANTIKTINKFNTSKSNEDFVPDPPSVFAAGDQVQHQIFGFGHITQLEGVEDKKIATIEFNGIGEKKIMLKFAKLKKI